MHRINLILDDKEFGLLEELKNFYGGKPQQILREALKFKYDKVFPPHMRDIKSLSLSKSEEELTPEQQCEKVGGVITTNEGFKVCKFIRPGTQSSMSYPIVDTEQFVGAARTMGLLD